MYIKQHTIKESVSISGVGLHTGENSTITFHPAPENYGIRFVRTDLEGNPEIPALVEYVVEYERSTTLGKDNVKIYTVEHVMSALVGLQIDNVRIELNGNEPPALDGSSIEYVKLLKKAGTVEQNANREFYVIDEPVHYRDDEKEVDIAALPFNGFRVTVMIDYNSSILGIQHATLVNLQDYEKEIAPARTFCFLDEVMPLLKKGLIQGGSLDNSLVLIDKEVSEEEIAEIKKAVGKPDLELAVSKKGFLSSSPLRYQNEPARHKLLDLIGDLGLLGAPLKAQILAARPGHKANVEFAKKIRSKIKQKKIIEKFQGSTKKEVVFDILAIQKILPHRYPFLLIDKITYFDEKRIEGVKNVTINEPFFVGHFEGNPIMPGVLQLEAMAQVGGVLLLNIIDNPQDHWVYFLAIDKARFKRPVRPGDQLVFKLELISLRRGICRMKGKAFVDNTLVCEAEMVASLVKKEDNR